MLIGGISEENHDEILDKFYQKLIDEWKYNLLDEFASNNVDKYSEEIAWESEYDLDYEYKIDKNSLASLINKETQDFITPIEVQDAKEMFDYIDLEGIVSSYYRSDDSSSGSGVNPRSTEPDIDSIFEGFLSSKFS